MDPKKFESLVAEGLDGIPEEFAKKLNNVVVTVEGEPSFAQRRQMKLRPWQNLFGLYQGIPQTKRGSGYTLVLPDKITIFQKPIEQAAGGDPAQIRSIVMNTVWHEIAHHFGLDEREVRHREHSRGK